MRSINARGSGGAPRGGNLGASGRAEGNGMSKEQSAHANATGVTNSPDITYFGSSLDSHGAHCTRTVLVTPHLARPRSFIRSKVAPKDQVSSSSANTRRAGKGHRRDGLPSSPRGVRVTPLLAGNGQERGPGQEGNTKYPCPNGNGFRPINAQIIRNSADIGSEDMPKMPSETHEVQTVMKARKGGYEYAGLL